MTNDEMRRKAADTIKRAGIVDETRLFYVSGFQAGVLANGARIDQYSGTAAEVPERARISGERALSPWQVALIHRRPKRPWGHIPRCGRWSEEGRRRPKGASCS